MLNINISPEIIVSTILFSILFKLYKITEKKDLILQQKLLSNIVSTDNFSQAPNEFIILRHVSTTDYHIAQVFLHPKDKITPRCLVIAHDTFFGLKNMIDIVPSHQKISKYNLSYECLPVIFSEHTQDISIIKRKLQELKLNNTIGNSFRYGSLKIFSAENLPLYFYGKKEGDKFIIHYINVTPDAVLRNDNIFHDFSISTLLVLMVGTAITTILSLYFI